MGRNGEGKSTLLRLLAGLETPDEGELQWSPGTVLGYVEQPLPAAEARTVREFVLSGAGEAGEVLFRYEQALAVDPTGSDVMRLQQWIDDHQAWSLSSRADALLERAGLNGAASVGSLSGGWRRKAMLTRAMVCEPNVLLLDEPTNHLDIGSIEWLENELREFSGLLIFISHDRHFIDQVAQSIVELDRSELFRHPVPYQAFLDSRAERLRVEAEQNAEFDRKLAQEERWIRQGIKARRTRNEGRVRRLEALRRQRAQRREVGGQARMEVQSSGQSGKQVFDLDAVSFGYGHHRIVDSLTTVVQRGDTLALVGDNGVGKTTLIRLLLGDLEPDAGTIKRGTRLEIAYFDQGRHQLDPDKSLMDTVAEGRSFIDINGRQLHVVSWLERFLFSPSQARSPVSTLSGGEANRLLLARLFSQPANLLVLDEPTNDLDIDTLELLEELIIEFPGTVILTSHDRYFVDNVATLVWGMPGGGSVVPVIGGYREWSEWLQRRPPRVKEKIDTPREASSPGSSSAGQQNSKPARRNGKLSYKVQREYDALPAQIETLEHRIAELEAETSDPAFYENSHDHVQERLNALQREQEALDNAMERWLELEEQVSG